MKPYEGDGDYIFISYSHKNSEKVDRIMNAIAEHGYNVWYDEGIHPGSNWIKTIVRKLCESKLVIAFISEEYMRSKFCNNEILYAYNNNKNIIPVYIEDVEISDEFDFMFSKIQSVPEFRYPDKKVFMEKLLNTEFFADMKRSKNGGTAAPKASEKSGASKQQNAGTDAQFLGVDEFKYFASTTSKRFSMAIMNFKSNQSADTPAAKTATEKPQLTENEFMYSTEKKPKN